MDITTPGGRIVWGHPTKARQKTDNNRQPIFKDGKPVMQYSFGLAIPKAEFAPVWNVMAAEAMKLYPSGQFPPSFAFKYVDGDGIDSDGKPFSAREGYAGCYVLAMSTEAFEPPLVKLVGPNQYTNLTADQFKTGDYARVALNIESHGVKAGVAGGKAGLYLNPRMVEFLGFGTLIVSGPDAMQLFGGQAVAPPAGASATPVGSAPMPIPPSTPPAYPTPPGAPPAMVAPAPVVAQPPMPLAAPPMIPQGGPPAFPLPTVSPSSYPAPPPVAPAHDFVATAAGNPPGMPGMPPVAPPPPVQSWTVAIGPPPAGYRITAYAPDGRTMTVVQA